MFFPSTQAEYKCAIYDNLQRDRIHGNTGTKEEEEKEDVEEEKDEEKKEE
jgi:hypothetical protein